MARMLWVTLICSDSECEYVVESAGELEELEAVACDCGCTLQVVDISEAEDAALSHPEPRRIGPAPKLHLAA
jgi:hypothetical protein